MIRPDLIVAWPSHLDYPLWREFIHNNRDRFAKVIVILTQMNTGNDYRPWLQEQLNKDGIISITNDQVLASEDWRNVAVNKGLGLSDAEWVWFTEPDFFPQVGFWNVIYAFMWQYRAAGVKQDQRLHPCSLFLKRSLLNELDKNFGVTKDRLDHFGLIQEQLEEKKEYVAIIMSDYWTHLNGLSQNMFLLQIGEQPNYEPEKFKEYCQKSLQISLPIHPEIKKLMEEYIK
jgi:hypothetical protein